MESARQELLIKKLSPDAKLPSRATNYSAGYDLYALEAGSVMPGAKALVKTGIAIRMPKLPYPFKVYGSIRSRSGLSVKAELETGAGVIDYDYNNAVGVVLRNFGGSEFVYEKHARIAQLVLEVHITPDVVEVEDLPEVENNDRVGGFGSTGL
jgi:dUTP pyrophosphatase